jgi:hypothetical protein
MKQDANQNNQPEQPARATGEITGEKKPGQ